MDFALYACVPGIGVYGSSDGNLWVLSKAHKHPGVADHFPDSLSKREFSEFLAVKLYTPDEYTLCILSNQIETDLQHGFTGEASFNVRLKEMMKCLNINQSGKAK